MEIGESSSLSSGGAYGGGGAFKDGFRRICAGGRGRGVAGTLFEIISLVRDKSFQGSFLRVVRLKS